MDNVRQYLLSITAAAVICGIVNGIIGKKGAYGAIVKLLTGLILAVTAISPITRIEISEFSLYTDNLSAEAEELTSFGKQTALDAAAEIIKTQTESYILDKASAMQLNITVDVTLTEDTPPVPRSVCIKGNVSPYAKELLAQYIANDLGVSEENQLWT